MKYLAVKDETGEYVKENEPIGDRYNLLVCSWAVGKRASEFVELPSEEEAIKYFHLKKLEQ